ncbi:MAG: prepilin-type N-terminal cleavage/methylation domain-containing protein [Planctomycetota bacterium]
MRTSRTHLQKHSGFTLLELLIVISIISILAVATFKIFGAMNRTAKKVKTQAQLTAIVAAAQEYFADFKVYPPSTNLYGAGDKPLKGISAAQMKYVIHRYLGMELLDTQTGKRAGPYIRDMDNSNLKGPEVEIDGRLCQIYSDAFWKATEEDQHGFELYCTTWERDQKTRNVIVRKPYAEDIPEDQQVEDVKAWSKGPDGKSTELAPFYNSTTVTESDKDNIMSWTK